MGHDTALNSEGRENDRATQSGLNKRADAVDAETGAFHMREVWFDVLGGGLSQRNTERITHWDAPFRSRSLRLLRAGSICSAHWTTKHALAVLDCSYPIVNTGGAQALITPVLQVGKGKQLTLLDHLIDADSFTAMASANSFFASSPTVILPPNLPNHFFKGGHYADATTMAPTPNGFTNPFTPGDTPMPIATTPGSLAGRKRSREDTEAPEEEGEGLGDGSTDIPATEENPQRQQFHFSHAKRPSISARKSQRVNGAAAEPDHLAQLVLPPQIREVTAEPLIDEATRVLGISWTRMDSTEALRINKAAYAKWIQNHYASLKDVSVWFENSAIPGYLVQARNGYSGQQEYYIFSNDLTEAKLVTTDPAQLVPRLKLLPALELAAPGGTIRAETDSITAAQNEVDGMLAAMAEDDRAIHGGLSRGCSPARAMDID
ncbi:hypothetical protein LTR37_017438 [Vermiconidia calcicola]|uniref:Uncharacterized protein n=1 Tax=Vermiconidia calcicola TaxID=1690605 RepID=A0ACC3MKA3_9PEZI|nr:hypothetical protein LTR37_017438 [Vermiconidia calcicola]